ncbi:MAG: DUF2314 domain-containing protein [Deltaproteobacteria bacterium]|nr:DUF2314 domain-containing protein [Deltaproteobacteria bacterium]MBW1847470.1 DUF2314 domain-containing protein [Deltaproteobacteria bacterium]MBW1985511.1 DUF2314 domain-containing protein [Deltaproteobacteria bacterium]MBW2365586.1 DUF2314 domain-containing protein [Deltaproteobacteria bacterium]
MKSRSILVAVFIATFLILFGCNQKSEPLTNQYDEKEMNQAIETAQLTFDKFLERFRNPQPGDEDFNVKVKIEDKNGVEHFWLSDLRLDSEPYIGIIGNDPGIVRNVKFGQQYSFQRADIRDWMFMSNGKMQGNYTLRVILKSMPEEESEEIKKNIGW